MPHTPKEIEEPLGLCFMIMFPHDRFDRFGSFISVIKGDGGDVVVEDVHVGDAVHDGVGEEGDVAIDGGGGATGEGPGFGFVVWESGVGVLKVGDCN